MRKDALQALQHTAHHKVLVSAKARLKSPSVEASFRLREGPGETPAPVHTQVNRVDTESDAPSKASQIPHIEPEQVAPRHPDPWLAGPSSNPLSPAPKLGIELRGVGMDACTVATPSQKCISTNFTASGHITKMKPRIPPVLALPAARPFSTPGLPHPPKSPLSDGQNM